MARSAACEYGLRFEPTAPKRPAAADALPTGGDVLNTHQWSTWAWHT
jgi:hypothetical protein